GIDVKGGPLLAEAFPVLLVLAVVGVTGRPLGGVLRRRRLAGARLPLGPRLGLRRIVTDAATTTVIVLAGALATATFAVAVWLRGPPDDAVSRLQDAGFPVYGSSSPHRVFDAVSFLAVDWSFAGMQTFGLVIGGLVVLAQVLVVAARRRQREVAWVMGRRMG